MVRSPGPCTIHSGSGVNVGVEVDVAEGVTVGVSVGEAVSVTVTVEVGEGGGLVVSAESFTPIGGGWATDVNPTHPINTKAAQEVGIKRLLKF